VTARLMALIPADRIAIAESGVSGRADVERVAALGADAVVLDAKVPGRLGGTGTAFDWEGVARALDRDRGRGRIVLAGGLNPENVSRAVRIVAPDIVDVSSGVESAPGIKDHARMRAFGDAVRNTGEGRE
jgi:phosphoribosylanthranilate isomerase